MAAQVLKDVDDSSSLIVQNTEEFLRDFSLVQFENQAVIAVFRSAMSHGKRIGDHSAVGKVYQLGNGVAIPAPLRNKVLKESPMCPGGAAYVPHGLLGQLCNMAMQGDLIFRIPNTETGKLIVLAPNYILEAIAGILLSRLEPFTPSFMRVYGFQYDNGPTKSVFMLQEELIPINDVIASNRDFIYAAFQISQALAVSQLASRFVHYDLHQGNIMARSHGETEQKAQAAAAGGDGGDDEFGFFQKQLQQQRRRQRRAFLRLPPLPQQVDQLTVNIYEIGNGQYLYSSLPFDAVIIDYGHVRMETEESVLSPNMMWTHPAHRRETMDWYAFNPYYDMFSFLYTQNLKAYQGKFPKWAGGQTFGFWSLWRLFLNPPPVEGVATTAAAETTQQQFMLNVIHWMQGNLPWRPLPERLSMKWTDPDTGLTFSRASTPEEMMARIAELIRSSLPAFTGRVENPTDIKTYLEANTMLISTQITKLDSLGITTKVHKLPLDILQQSYYYYKTDNDLNEVLPGIAGDIATIQSRRWSNRDVVASGSPRELVTRCAPGAVWQSWNKTGLAFKPADQKITVAEIDVERGIREGYRFRLDCCRLDLRTYFQDSEISSGIGINAAFFKILRPGASYLPVGTFRSEGFESHIPIPAEYQEWYGVVAIDDRGRLKIDKLTNANQYRAVLTVGPVLVWYDDHGPRTMVGTNLAYGQAGRWPRRINLSNPRFQCQLRPVPVGVTDCDRIAPGEFAHAGNPNPRSALGIKGDGKIILVTVQGRRAEAAGMDLEQLAQLMMGLGAIAAVNLDGGRSSRMVWKNPGEKLIRLAGEGGGQHGAEAYPVGNVLSFVKK